MRRIEGCVCAAADAMTGGVGFASAGEKSPVVRKVFVRIFDMCSRSCGAKKILAKNSRVDISRNTP